jgi:hypothetical protein
MEPITENRTPMSHRTLLLPCELRLEVQCYQVPHLFDEEVASGSALSFPSLKKRGTVRTKDSA